MQMAAICKTQIFVPGSLVGWTTMRVMTESSRYHVTYGVVDGRRVAVLRGESHGKLVHETDGDPRVGEASLFSLPMNAWIGQRLQIGAVRTSSVVSVAFEDDARILSEVTTWVGPLARHTESEPYWGPRVSVVPATSPSPPPPPPAPALEGAALYLALVESAAARLRRVRSASDLKAALDADPRVRERFGDALAECLVMVKAIAAANARDESR